MKLLLPALALAAGCAHPMSVVVPTAGVPAASSAGVVQRVVDGDTITVDGTKIRLLGVDSPEIHRPGTPVQCAGPEASAFAHRLLDGRHVTLVADPTQADTDRYGRSLRYVRLDDGRDYSTEIVRAGLARVYTYGHRPVSEYAVLEQAQKDAMAARRGIWGMCSSPAPGD